MMRIGTLVIPLAALAACASTPAATVVSSRAVVPANVARSLTGLDRVIGKDARSLVSLFGAADQDVQEPGARKLQFGGDKCILDVYLYAAAQGREPVATYVDARTPGGQDIDKAGCVAALSKR